MNDIEIEKVGYQMHNNNEDAVDILSAQDLLDVIQKMPPGFKTVFNMYVIEGYSHKEIADELNISVNTSKSQLSRAKVYLQKVLIKEKVV